MSINITMNTDILRTTVQPINNILLINTIHMMYSYIGYLLKSLNRKIQHSKILFRHWKAKSFEIKRTWRRPHNFHENDKFITNYQVLFRLPTIIILKLTIESWLERPLLLLYSLIEILKQVLLMLFRTLYGKVYPT